MLTMLSKTWRNFIEKSHCNINPREKLLKSKKIIFKVSKEAGAGTGDGTVIWIYGTSEPEPKKIVKAQQH
jgi:hypothetical protein